MNFKKKKETIITFVFVVVFIFLLGGIYISLPANEKSYIGKNSTTIDFTNYEDYSALEIFNDSIKDKKIIMTNEERGMKENAQIQYKFITYLMDEWKLKYFLVDTGYAEAAVINEYLQTGDEALLESYNNSSRSYVFSEDSKLDMIKRLYLKNSQLSDNKKLNIIGIGMNEPIEFVDLYFKTIISKHSALTEKQVENINKFLKNLNSNDFPTNITSEKEIDESSKIILEYIESFYTNIYANEDAYKEALGEDFNNIEFVINNIKNMQEIKKIYFQDDSNMKNGNEKYSQYLYENFKNIYESINMKRCYMHLPQIYSYQHEVLGTDFLGAKIAKDKKFKDKILGINILYENGKFNLSNTQVQINTVREDLRVLIKEAELDKEDIVINLDNSRSPYRRKFTPLYFPFEDDALYPQENPGGELIGGIIGENPGVITDYFQGVIIIKNPSIDESFYNKIYNQSNP